MSFFNDIYARCADCDLVFKETFVSSDDERKRYALHNNDVNDQKYLEYLNHLFRKAEDFLSPGEHTILDFGCGPSEGLKSLLENKKKFNVCSYDPYFFKFEYEQKIYDVIYASECFEHFNNPLKTITKICNVLKVEGVLAVSTLLHNSDTDFSKWWYAKDPTHVVFYSEKTVNYISKKFGLDVLFIDESRIIFKIV